MIRDRFLSRAQWEGRLKAIGAEPLPGMTALNSGAEWWRIPGGFPFTVPVEPDGRADFWSIQKLAEQLSGPRLFDGLLDDDDPD